MPDIESGCHELRVTDAGHSWRIIYAIEPDAIVILEIFDKGSKRTPPTVMNTCRKRIREYRRLVRGR